MAKYYDIAIDSTGKMVIADGDFAIQEAPAVDAQLIVLSTPACWTQTPVLYVNLYSYLNTPFTVERRNKLITRIRTMMALDKLVPVKLEVTAVDKININGRRD